MAADQNLQNEPSLLKDISGFILKFDVYGILGLKPAVPTLTLQKYFILTFKIPYPYEKIILTSGYYIFISNHMSKYVTKWYVLHKKDICLLLNIIFFLKKV